MKTTTHPSQPLEQDILEGLAINLKLSQDLLALLEEEKSALRAMDTQGLLRISRDKDAVLAKIQYLDNTLKNSLTEKKNAAAAKLTAEQLRTVGLYKTKINSARQEIRTKNTINKRFTEDTLGYLGEAISLFTRSIKEENTYRVPGRSQARGKDLPNFISCKA